MVYLMLAISVTDADGEGKVIVTTRFGKRRNYLCQEYVSNDITEIKELLSEDYKTCIGSINPDTVSDLDKKRFIEIEDTIKTFEEKGIIINRLSDYEYTRYITNEYLRLSPGDKLIYLDREIDIDSDYSWEVFIDVYTVMNEVK